MLRELGSDVSALGVARQYTGICDVFVIDKQDTELIGDIEDLGMNVVVTDTVMKSKRDKVTLAKVILDLCE